MAAVSESMLTTRDRPPLVVPSRTAASTAPCPDDRSHRRPSTCAYAAHLPAETGRAGSYGSKGCSVPERQSARGGLGPRVAHGPVERVVRHLFPAVLGEGVVGAVGVFLELGERARLLLDAVGGARRYRGHGVVLAVGEAQQRRAARVVPVARRHRVGCEVRERRLEER